MLKKVIRSLSAVFTVTLIAGTLVPLQSQTAFAETPVGRQLEIETVHGGWPRESNPKLDSRLNRLTTAATTRAVDPQQQSIGSADEGVRVVIEAIAGQIESATDATRGVGIVEAMYDDSVQAIVPTSALSALAESPVIRFIRPVYEAVPDAITSEGVTLVGANTWQSAGYDGAGVKVAVLDGGFSGWDEMVIAGELPANVITHWSTSLAGPGTSTHGTACAEIVYDMAPGARLYLVNFSGDVEFGNAVDWLISQGVSIISSSMGWPALGPGDGTGPINDIVARASAAGILWSQSAGNSAQRYWRGNFIDSNVNGWNDFNGSPIDEGQTISVGAGQKITAWMTWNDPWGSSTNDYDLLLLDNAGQIVAGSTNPQAGTTSPYEAFAYTATSAGVYSIRIGKLASAAARQLQVWSGAHNLEYQVAAGSFSVPADSVNVMTVGAVFWNSPNAVEVFSSQGPTIDGRIKPDIVAPDGVSTATAGASNGVGFASGGTGFFGTSASAPAAAGAATLVKQMYLAYTAAQVQSFIETSCIDLDATGKDDVSGYGRLRLPKPFQSPPGAGKIAFTSYRDGNGEIYVMNPDGSGQTRLTNNAAEDQQPAWSPDGSKIAFVSHRDGSYNIYVMNSDGSNAVRLTNSSGDWLPAWSPDGTRIAFYSGRTSLAQVFVMNTDGTNQTQLTTIGGVRPAWSPDGMKIAFGSVGADPGIYTMNANGTGQVRLTAFNSDSFPSWSPDGTKIVFCGYEPGIAVINADGSGRTRLTSDPVDLSPSWSPDGTCIVFASFWRDQNYEIYVMNTDGTNPIRLTTTVAGDRNPTWLNAPPGVSTDGATAPATTSAQLNGTLAAMGTSNSANVSFEYGLATAYGNTTQLQTITQQSPFSANITGLTPNTAYHFRAKAIALGGTSYGRDRTFTTTFIPPTTATNLATQIQFTSATLNGNLADNGTAASVAVSFDWGASAGILSNSLAAGTMQGAGPFSANLTGLSAAGTYYYRAKAVGDGPAVFGNVMSFTTQSTPPSVTTDNVNASWISPYSAWLAGTLTSKGTAATVDVRFEWRVAGSSGAWSTSTSKTITNISPLPFYIEVTGLQPNTQYEYRAKAAGHGEVNGSPTTLTTRIPAPPTITTENATEVGYFSATLHYALISTGSATSGNISFQWGTSPGSLTNEFKAGTWDYGPIPPPGGGSGGGPNLTGLSANTTYHYRAKATGDGIGYGDPSLSFTTLPAVSPAVTTGSAASITTVSAALSGNLTNTGTASPVNVSFEWRTSSGTYAGTIAQPTAVAGPFSAVLSGLTPSTAYYFRAKADGGPHGVTYGLESSFATSAAAPPPPSGGGGGGAGGGGAPVGQGVTSLSIYTNDEGLFNLAAIAKSEDGRVSVSIAKGVRARTKEDTALKSIKIVPLDVVLQTQGDWRLVSLAHELTPDGATFSPPVGVTLFYDPAKLSQNTDVNTLALAVYNTSLSRWDVLESVHNRAEYSLTAQVGHFSIYAVVGKDVVATPPPPPAAPAKFAVSGVAVSAARVPPGQTLTVSARVGNTGGSSGEFEVTLKINNAVETTKRVSVAAGGSSTVTFTFIKVTPGTYLIDIDGVTASFIVEEPSPQAAKVPAQLAPAPEAPPKQGAGSIANIGILAAAVVVVVAGGTFGFLWKRRRA